MPVVPISQHSILVQAYNPLLAFILALFFALSIRFFILLFSAKNRGVLLTTYRLLAGIIFLLLGWLYALFVSPLLIWDRPARATAAVTFVAVLLWTVARSAGSGATKSPGFLSVTIRLILFVILLFAATATIIRTGYIALVGDRVTLLVDVTGETRSETPNWSSFTGQTPNQPLTLHHVVIWLPTGEKAADTWIFGDSFAVRGTAIRFSPTLRAMKIPNLYALVEIHNWYSTPERLSTQPAVRYWIPNSGPLSVHPWWRPIQNRLLAWWAGRDYYPPRLIEVRMSVPPKIPTWSQGNPHQVLSVHTGDTSPRAWWAIQMSDNESPLYPLVDAAGKPVQNKFLLVLRPNAIPTSRGSSPLEDKKTSRH